MHPAVTLALTIATLLVAAKAHGRQLRLERERAGYHSVEFGGTNPPWVEELWRRDRIRYWSVALVGAAVAAAGGLARRDGWLVAAALPEGMLLAFCVTGLWSGARTRSRDRGTLGWWALVAVGVLVTGASAVLR